VEIVGPKKLSPSKIYGAVVVLVVALVKVTWVLDVDSAKLKAPIVTDKGPVFCKVTSKLSALEPGLEVTDSALTTKVACAAPTKRITQATAKSRIDARRLIGPPDSE